MSKLPPKDLTLDHVVPVSRGGLKSWTNIVTACRDCNQRKGGRTPREAEMPLKSRPAEPKWLTRVEMEGVPVTAPESWRIYLAEDAS